MQTSRLIAATLLALVAACGSGTPVTSKQFRYQQSAQLDTENGLQAFTISTSCLSVDVVPDPGEPPPDPTDAGTPPPVPDPTDAGTPPPLPDPTDPGPPPPPPDPTDPGPPPPPPDPTDPGPPPPPPDPPDAGPPDLIILNPDSCGDVMNGLPPNLLGLKGLHPKGLKEAQFQKWFAHDTQAANLLMKYLVRCSMEAGQALVYTDPDDGVWAWAGGLGLAPEWTAGNEIPEAEQQLVSACVAAHANGYGAHVAISLLGTRADGTPLPRDEDELSTYPIAEGCFFGNLFHKGGVYSASDRAMPLTDDQSSLRACALPDRSGGDASSSCPPIKYAGSCRDLCQPDPSGVYYTSCTIDGETFLPLTTRITPAVEYTCGDGICQITESCGVGTTWNDCGLDCGPCE